MSKEHDDALDAAIQAVGVAEEWTGVITGWVVAVAYVDTTEDGDGASGIATIYPSGHMAWPLVLGTLRGATLRAEHLFLHPEERD